MHARMTKHSVPRRTHTVIPDDGIFRFKATPRAEGRHTGYRVTIPAPIARGLIQCHASRVLVRFHRPIVGGWHSVVFEAVLRHSNAKQVVFAASRNIDHFWYRDEKPIAMDIRIITDTASGKEKDVELGAPPAVGTAT